MDIKKYNLNKLTSSGAEKHIEEQAENNSALETKDKGRDDEGHGKEGTGESILNYLIELKEQIKSVEDKLEKNNTEVNEIFSSEIEKINPASEIKKVGDYLATVNTSLENLNKDRNIDEKILLNINSLIESSKNLDDKIDKLEEKNKELVSKILFQVLQKEISEDSRGIIINNFKLIYEEIKESTRIEILVSEHDFLLLEQEFENKHENVFIKKDENIAKGNLLVLSDKGNFDNNLMKKLDLILNSIN